MNSAHKGMDFVHLHVIGQHVLEPPIAESIHALLAARQEPFLWGRRRGQGFKQFQLFTNILGVSIPFSRPT